MINTTIECVVFGFTSEVNEDMFKGIWYMERDYNRW